MAIGWACARLQARYAVAQWGDVAVVGQAAGAGDFGGDLRGG